MRELRPEEDGGRRGRKTKTGLAVDGDMLIACGWDGRRVEMPCPAGGSLLAYTIGVGGPGGNDEPAFGLAVLDGDGRVVVNLTGRFDHTAARAFAAATGLGFQRQEFATAYATIGVLLNKAPGSVEVAGERPRHRFRALLSGLLPLRVSSGISRRSGQS